MRWLVPALCATAAVLALMLGAGAGDAGSEDPQRAPPTQAVPSAPTGPPEELARLQETVTEVTPLGEAQARALLSSCLEVDPDADPALSPDPAAVEVIASGGAAGTAALVWAGPTPQYDRALGSCVAVRQDNEWRLVGRATRRDVGPGSASLTWHPAAADRGAAAMLAGRLAEGAATLLVVLEEGRVLRQSVESGVVAVAWQPVERPLRVVVLGSDGEVRYDGSLTGYPS